MPGAGRTWIGAVLAVLAVLMAAACTPTVDLGSNVGSTGLGSDGSSASGSTGVAGTTSDTGTGAGVVGTTSGTGTGTDTNTNTNTDTDTDTDTGTDTGGSSETGSDTSTQSCRDAFPAGLPCLNCAELECCDEIDLCLGQPECDCFFLCVTAGTPPLVCEAMCDPSSGAAAVSTCLSQACTFDCGG